MKLVDFIKRMEKFDEDEGEEEPMVNQTVVIEQKTPTIP